MSTRFYPKQLAFAQGKLSHDHQVLCAHAISCLSRASLWSIHSMTGHSRTLDPDRTLTPRGNSEVWNW